MLSAEQAAEHSAKRSMIFAKTDTPHFTQLIFSWNAFRPKQGYFKFNVQVRDAKTQRWYDWHRMTEWGANVQRSFRHETLGSTYHHVRLEMPSGNYADGLRISVEALEGANLKKVRGLFVSVSNLRTFEAERLDRSITGLPSLALSRVPQQSQKVLDHPKKDVLCSPTSCCMLTSYLLKKRLDPIDFANKSYDNGLNAYGSWPFNIAHAFERARGKCFFRVARLESFGQLHSMLKKEIPVVVSVRGHIDGAFKDYDDGHLLLVVGWNQAQQKVICHDPAFESNEETRVSYDIASFLRAWEKSRRLAYCAMHART